MSMEDQINDLFTRKLAKMDAILGDMEKTDRARVEREMAIDFFTRLEPYEGRPFEEVTALDLADIEASEIRPRRKSRQ
jgi:hypothetical protein